MENQRSRRAQRHRVIRPPGVVDVQVPLEPVGLDLICNSCGQHIPNSRRLDNLYHNYSPDGPQGSPLTRCFVRCPNCSDVLVLGRNIGDADNLVVIADTDEYIAAADAVPDRDTNLQPITRDMHERVHRVITEPGLRMKPMYYFQTRLFLDSRDT